MRKLLACFDWQPVDEVADELVSEFFRLVPLAKAGNETSLAKAIDVVVGHAKGHSRKRKWGFFSATRCSNAVKWRLLERGYSGDVAERLARALAVGMSHDR